MDREKTILQLFLKKEVIIAVLIVTVLTFFATTNYLYRHKYHLKMISFKPIKNYFAFKEDVKASVTSNMGTDFILRMDISFPCQNRKQQTELENNKQAIISDFLMETDQTKIETWVKQKNMSEMKSRLLTIANRYTSNPVDSVLFESLNW